MPQGFAMKDAKQHFERYKEMGKIDHCTYFVKNYLAFNFYCKVRFEGKDKVKQDRDYIDALKDDQKTQNRFLEYFEEHTDFLGLLKKFDKILEDSSVTHKSRLVSFKSVQVRSVQQGAWSKTSNGVTYTLEIHSGRVSDNMLDLSVKVQTKNAKYSIERRTFDIEGYEFESALNRQGLNKHQIDKTKSLFRERLDGRVENIAKLIHRSDKNMLDESNRELIYRGLIEILYQLRNALLHSDVRPWDQSIQKVYEQATLILQEVLEFLPF